MTRDEFTQLREGDIVQGKASGQAYIVTGNFRGRVTAVRTVDITQPDEWVLIPQGGPKAGKP